MQQIRFGVQAPSGHRAATWKIWTPGGKKSDVYIICRRQDGEFKASLHQSGKWHISFTSDFYESRFDESTKPPTRFIETWNRPKEVSGHTLAFRIVVPWFSPTIKPEEKTSKIFWIPTAPKGYQHEFVIFITHPLCVLPECTWPGKDTMDSKLVGSFPLINRETVWVVYTTHPFIAPTKTSYSAQLFKDINTSTMQKQGLRAIGLIKEPDESRVFYDFPAQYETAN